MFDEKWRCQILEILKILDYSGSSVCISENVSVAIDALSVDSSKKSDFI